jgi:uncharacterized protein Usg
MSRYPDRTNVIDDGSEHPHRMSLQVRGDVLHEFVDRWSHKLSEAGVQVGFVVHKLLTVSTWLRAAVKAFFLPGVQP